MELAHDRVQWRAMVLAVLKLRVLLPVCSFVNFLVSYMYIEDGRMDGRKYKDM
jgi:hypothetical protein